MSLVSRKLSTPLNFPASGSGLVPQPSGNPPGALPAPSEQRQQPIASQLNGITRSQAPNGAFASPPVAASGARPVSALDNLFELLDRLDSLDRAGVNDELFKLANDGARENVETAAQLRDDFLGKHHSFSSVPDFKLGYVHPQTREVHACVGDQVLTMTETKGYSTQKNADSFAELLLDAKFRSDVGLPPLTTQQPPSPDAARIEQHDGAEPAPDDTTSVLSEDADDADDSISVADTKSRDLRESIVRGQRSLAVPG